MQQYKDLVAKLEAIQNRANEAMGVLAPPSGPEFPEDTDPHMGECGDDMPPKAPGVSSDDEYLVGEEEPSGQGPTIGLRDLINALQSIESGHSKGVDEVADGGFGDATTEPDPQEANIQSMMRTGTDLASKGKEAPKMNGGGNPLRESLVKKLANHYNEVKSR